ncbi:hypothetical protein PPACK8108_LOCUS19729 [Phakopsora pachyrhizi]|uniref:DUF913 domain-containing protein n=1 Tax=Phakopsora pachyrhizi TaxID=170000 RepID=A0AAV0BCQ8_PHAPC|nr:hypothetical protein PPACK8108_LOCUS19368 [Phakopsora pachyrhizi]CAH7685242.1 hypothetical protein PPACK8108_LOCUS19729 [Phakopsora pachyrhizi]
MPTLIHWEPTSWAILQEAGLPVALYDVIDGGIKHTLDVFAAFPSALGALYLNEVGLRQWYSRVAIQTLFSVFTHENDARKLRDRDKATVVRGTIAACHPGPVNANDVLMNEPATGPTDLLLHSTLKAANRKEKVARVNVTDGLKLPRSYLDARLGYFAQFDQITF